MGAVRHWLGDSGHKFLCGLGVGLTLAVAPALAGTVQLTGHAHDSTGQLHIPKTVTHPTLAIADTGNVNVPGAHARSWGAAVVVGGVLKKSTGGEGWVTNLNPPKHQYWYANSGTGEFIIDDPDADLAQLQLLIRRTGEAVDPARPPDAPPEVGQYPSQGIFAEHDFTVQVKLDANVVQDGVRTNLFSGNAVLRGPQDTNPGVSAFGDFDALDVFSPVVLNGNPGQERLGAIVATDVLSPNLAGVQTGKPFTLNLDLIMSQYEIDSLPFEPPLVDTGDILASSAGDLVVEIVAQDDFGRQLNITPFVPEPGSLALALIAATSAAALLRRR